MNNEKRKHKQLNQFVAKGIVLVNIETIEDENFLKKIENNIFLNKKNLIGKK